MTRSAMQTEMHPQEREMLEDAEITNYDLYMEELQERRKKQVEDVIEQIRLVKAVCDDALNNIIEIRKSL